MTQPIKRALALLTLAVLLPGLTGCDALSPEKQAYVLCLAIDRQEEQLEVTIQLPKSGGSSDSSAGPEQASGYAYVSVPAESLADALERLEVSVPYPLNFSQLRLIVLSSEYAVATDLREPLRLLLSQRNLRASAQVAVAVGEASAVVRKQQPEFGMRMSKHIDNALRTLQGQGLLPNSALGRVVAAMEDGDPLLALCAVKPEQKQEQQPSAPAWSEAAAPEAPAEWSDEATRMFSDVAGALPRDSENPVEYLGAALLSAGRAVGLLTGSEMLLFTRLCQDATLRCAVRQDSLQIQALLPATLADATAEVDRLLAKLQGLGSDPLGFALIAAGAFPTDDALAIYGFRARYATASRYVGEK